MPERHFDGVENPDVEPPSKTSTEVWAEIHKKKDGTWVNDLAHSTHDTMEMHITQISQGSSSSGLAPAPLSPEDQIEVMMRVFRPGRGYIAGVGPRLPSSVLGTPADSSQSSQNFGSRMISEEEHNRRIAELEQRFNQQLDERFQQLIPILRQSASTPILDDLLTRLFSPSSPRREDDDAANSRYS